MTVTPFVFTESIQAVLGDKLLRLDTSSDMPVAHVRASDWFASVKALHDSADLGFRFLTSLCGMHYPAGYQGGEERLGMVIHLHNMQRGFRMRLKCDLPFENPVVASLVPLFSTANWLERETFDNLGIRFEGHPNLKRILNVDHMTVFPLRKDFPLEDQSREDKNNAMFGR